MGEYVYIKELHENFYLVGSVGRRRYFNELHKVYSKFSDTLPKILEEEVNKPETKHDIDLLYIGDIKELETKYSNSLLRKTVDLLVVKKKDKSFYPQVTKYDIFVCPTKPKHYRYFYYIFSLVGAKTNIILRNKVKALGLKLNRRGIFRSNTDISDQIKFNHSKSIFYNVEKILKFIYNK